MSNASIGSGTPSDSNENHPRDGLPSKTLGAETGLAHPAAAAKTSSVKPHAKLDNINRQADSTRAPYAPTSVPAIDDSSGQEAAAEGLIIKASPDHFPKDNV